MFDFEIARYLYRASFLYEKIHSSVYKARAYFKAALSVDGYSTDVENLYCNDALRTLPSIGVSIEKSIGEIIKYNRLSLIDALLGEIPASIFDLFEYANIRDILLQKLIAHKIFGFAQIEVLVKHPPTYLSASEMEMLRGALNGYLSRRFQHAQVYEIANDIINSLRGAHMVIDISMSDGLYLREETLSTGDVICTSALDFSDLLDYIKTLPLFQVVLIEENSVTLKRFDIPFKVRVLSEDVFREEKRGLHIEQNKNEISSSKNGMISRFYGDLHMHTNYSDGLHSIEQMRDKGVELGYKYIAITDHSQSLKPRGMSEFDIITQIKKIRDMNTNSAIPVLAGIEVDILADGSLDIPDNLLREFDIVIASVHSHLNQPPLMLHDRMSKALSNKYVNILAHPTGRLLGKPGKPTVSRDEMSLNFDYLLQMCLENDVALEVNCFPERYDLSLDNMRKAISAGAKISIGTDAHSMYHMSCAKYALDTLKMANVPAKYVLNCQSFSDLKDILNIKRGSGEKNVSVFEEKFRNFRYYFSDNQEILSGQIKTVGIDLTGSEEKASGFAILSGAVAETMPVFTDNEMISHISKVAPAVVSIDSPLSLPKGRCCGDKNCKCSKYGIMRDCEITLKRFGIGVYPCLIDSMVNLTMRGMKLATRLRELGYNVIESYPGVAQDLLHIPRKRKGLELLLNGMKNFGIDGIRDDVTHDEADAITSALVGYFYLDNKYVGMGNEKEDYLIVPKLATDLFGKGIVIGLVGHIAAGKTTIAEYLRFKHGFTSMRFSKLIAEQYDVSNRDDLQRIGLEIANDTVKQKKLSDFMIQKMNDGENYVIDGIRQIVDCENLTTTLGNRFILLCVEAPFVARANRYNKLNPNTSKEEFAKIDSHMVEKSIDAIATKSNYKVINGKSYKELMSKLDSLLSKLSN